MRELIEQIYRVNLKKADGWQRYKRARLGISVGKPQHEDYKLYAALLWVSRRFPEIDVRVSDTLQRYNFPGEPNDNFDVALAAGDAWIERNRWVIDQFPQVNLFRWNDVLYDKDMPHHHAFIQEKLKEPLFQAAFDIDMKAHVARTGKSVERCHAFAIEELAVFNMLQEKRPAADVYPGTFLTCRRYLRDDFSLVRIDFDRIKTKGLAA